MNRPESTAMLLPIPDVQSERDERRIAIDQVGIKGLRYPLPFVDQDGAAHTTIATCNVYVALAEDRKGTHMSRFVAWLDALATSGQPLDAAALRQRHAALSRREQEVMALVVAGRLNKQVGFELGISEITVKAHRGRMMRKMDARSLADLVTMAARLGVSPSQQG